MSNAGNATISHNFWTTMSYQEPSTWACWSCKGESICKEFVRRKWILRPENTKYTKNRWDFVKWGNLNDFLIHRFMVVKHQSKTQTISRVCATRNTTHISPIKVYIILRGKQGPINFGQGRSSFLHDKTFYTNLTHKGVNHLKEETY